jgi:hypothetical protein
MALMLHPEVWLVFQDGKVKNMNALDQAKCAYSWCKCDVKDGEMYCSDYCSDADDTQETEIQCDCKHAPCVI